MFKNSDIILGEESALAMGNYTFENDSSKIKVEFSFGYKKIKSPKLIEDFCGTPYVCVNKSIESFLPNKLSNVISKKICNISLNKLIENPNKHDKIEFDI